MENGQLENFEMYLYERENAPATIQKYLTDIRTLLRYLGEDKVIEKNGCWIIRNGYWKIMQ